MFLLSGFVVVGKETKTLRKRRHRLANTSNNSTLFFVDFDPKLVG